MAEMICELEGSRGRVLCLYDTKIVIKTKKSVGSLLTGNITDGEKTIYLCDIVGVQHKKSGLLIGYLQFETPSMQMNNKNDNFFSENTFTYESGKNGITNELIEAVYKYVTDRIEELKYRNKIINQIPNFESMKLYKPKKKQEQYEHHNDNNCDDKYEVDFSKGLYDSVEFIDFNCPRCGILVSFLKNETNHICPYCDTEIEFK